MADVGLDSPDNTSDGVLSKRWVCRNGERCLLKGGTLLDQEPYNEVIATELFSRLLSEDDYVPYTLIEWGGAPVSSCPNFVGPTEEFIPAYYVNEVLPSAPHRDSYRHYVECCAALGVEGIETALGKMILCDDIMANTDRHWRNFGLIRDVETLEYRTAPLFDTGSSLWCRVPTRELAYTPFVVDMRPFYEDADRQLPGSIWTSSRDSPNGPAIFSMRILQCTAAPTSSTRGCRSALIIRGCCSGKSKAPANAILSLMPEKHPQRHRGKSPKLLLPCRLGN